MSEYTPLGRVCLAVRWMASEGVLNKTATTCGFETLANAMPDDARADWNQEQVDNFRHGYENDRMRAVFTAVYWPAYSAEKETFPGYADAANDPWL